MQSNILRTKLTPPSFSGKTIPREALLDRLNADTENRVVLISAPAGFGKTILATQWIKQQHTLCAWLTLDKNERDLTPFITYLLAAVRECDPWFASRTEHLLTAPLLPLPEDLIDALIGDLELSLPLVVFLDDFHTICFGEMDRTFVRLVHNLPRHIRLVVISRIDPPWPISSWVVRGWLTEIRAKDLRFSPEEAQSYFRGSNLPLSDQAIVSLQQRIDGWAAGLHLARLSLAQTAEPEMAVAGIAGSNRLIADFLMQEVVSIQPQTIKKQLAASSLVERFCSSLLNCIFSSFAENADGGRFIDHLERTGLFLNSLDSNSTWYQYNLLFRQFLHDQFINMQLDDLARQKVHRLAGEWFAERSLVEEAFDQFLCADSLDRAAELVLANLDATLDQDFSCRTLAAWLARFTPEAVSSRPALLVAQGHVKRVQHDIAGLKQLLKDASSLLHLKQSADRNRELLDTHIDTLRAFCLYWEGNAAGLSEPCAPRPGQLRCQGRHYPYSGLDLCGGFPGRNGQER